MWWSRDYLEQKTVEDGNKLTHANSFRSKMVDFFVVVVGFQLR